jgi:hypothetical protein
MLNNPYPEFSKYVSHKLVKLNPLTRYQTPEATLHFSANLVACRTAVIAFCTKGSQVSKALSASEKIINEVSLPNYPS